ncbi:hypothetical protein ACFXB3_23850 [Streptomyces sp. NPDC059447]|uniref:hypothetical protein n=1 Tax=Streptomyces sp. NPDC059447 TaxID=3346834 RepID=UPI00368D1775
MTARLRRARPGSPELQALVDELADRLGRSVAVDDPLARKVCTSRHMVVPEKKPGEEETAAIAPAADAMPTRMYGEHSAADTRKTDERDPALALVGADVAALTAAQPSTCRPC